MSDIEIRNKLKGTAYWHLYIAGYMTLKETLKVCRMYDAIELANEKFSLQKYRV